MGCCDVKLRNNKDKVVVTRVYVTKGQHESLLGKDDAIALGILKLDRDGDTPETEAPEAVRCITPEVLKDPIEIGIVLGGQTQPQIDAEMNKIAEEYSDIFEGVGRAKCDPIHTQMKEGAIPVTQPKRQIPLQFKEETRKKLQYLKDNGLIEGPLPPGECKGWLTNMVITKKAWNSDEVRINIDTKRMNDQVVPTKMPIPSP